jgi:hypothetical protein
VQQVLGSWRAIGKTLEIQRGQDGFDDAVAGLHADRLAGPPTCAPQVPTRAPSFLTAITVAERGRALAPSGP